MKKNNFKKFLKIGLFFSSLFAISSPLFLIDFKNNNDNNTLINKTNFENSKIQPRDGSIGPTSINSFYQLNGLDSLYMQEMNLSGDKPEYRYANIYPSQHFGKNWVGVNNYSYVYDNDVNNQQQIVDQIKDLIIFNSKPNIENKCINNLPLDFTKENMMIVGGQNNDPYHFYIDNFEGSIVVEIKINKFVNSNGVLITPSKPNDFSNALSAKIQLVGFKKASSETNFPSTILTNGKIDGYDQVITIENIGSFFDNNLTMYPKLAQTYLGYLKSAINCILDPSKSTQLANSNNNQIVPYPGLGVLKTQFEFKNFFKQQYIDNNYHIYDEPSNDRKPIGTFIFKSSGLKNISFNIQSEQYNPSNIKYTYINENNYQVLPSYREIYASTLSYEQVQTILNDQIAYNSSMIINPPSGIVGGNINLLKVKPDGYTFNDLKGELYVDVLLPDKTSSQSIFWDNIETPSSNLPDYAHLRSYRIIFTNFAKRLPTSITPVIDATNKKFNNIFAQITGINSSLQDNLPSEISSLQINTSQNLLNKLFICASQDPSDPLGLLNIPVKTLMSDTVSFEQAVEKFVNQYVEFIKWENPNNLGMYYFTNPNDLDGTLEVELKLKSYYSSINGAHIVSEDNPLILKTKIINLKQNNNALFVSDGGTLGIKFDQAYHDYLPQFINNIPESKIQGFIKSDNVIYMRNNNGEQISPNPTLLSKVNVFNVANYFQKTLNDPLTSNLTGCVNLHYHIKGVNDPINGLPINGDFTTLFSGFKKIIPTEINNVVSLDNTIYAADILYAPNFINEVYSQILEKYAVVDGRNILVNLKNIFNNDLGIPKVIKDIINASSLDRKSLSEQIVVSNTTLNSTEKNNYSKLGTIPVPIKLATYYDINGVQQSFPNAPYYESIVNFINFKAPEPTIVQTQVSGDNLTLAESIFPNGVFNAENQKQNEIAIKKYLITKEKQQPGSVFVNVPNLFFASSNGNYDLPTFSISNIKVNNELGNISFQLKLNYNFFDADANFVDSSLSDNQNTYTFDVSINGFKTTSNTAINSNVFLKKLIFNGNNLPSNLDQYLKSQQTESNLNYENLIATNKNENVLNLEDIINQNLQMFIQNLYLPPLDEITTPLFEILPLENQTSVIPNFSEGKIEFRLSLNYYYGSDGIKMSTDPNYGKLSQPLVKNVAIIGFNQVNAPTSNNYIQDVSKPINPFYNNLHNISKKAIIANQTKPEIKNLFLDVIHNDQNRTILNSLFSNLPTVFEPNNVLDITNIIDSGDEQVTVSFKLINVFVQTNGNIGIGTNNIDVLFKGFALTTQTIINPIVDLTSITSKKIKVDLNSIYPNQNLNSSYITTIQDIVNVPLNPLSIQLPLWNFFSTQFSSIIKEIILQNNASFIEWNGPTNQSFVDGINVEIVPGLIDATKGSLDCNIKLNKSYDENGKLNPNPINRRVTIKGFKIYSQTIINNNNDSYANTYINQISLSEIGKGTIFPSSWINTYAATKGSFLNLLTTAFSKQFPNNDQSTPSNDINYWKSRLLIGDSIENLLNEQQRKQLQNISELTSIITDSKIDSYNDFDGSFKYSISIQNYFNDHGIWTVSDQPLWVNGYSISFQNSTSKFTSFEKTDASLNEFMDYLNVVNKYKDLFEPSDYQNITDTKNKIFNNINRKNLSASAFYDIAIKNDSNLIIFNRFFKMIATMSVNFNQTEALAEGNNGNLKWVVYKNPLYVYNQNNINTQFIGSLTTNNNNNNVVVQCDSNITTFNTVVDDKKGIITFKNMEFKNIVNEQKATISNVNGLKVSIDSNTSKKFDLTISGFYKDSKENDLITLIAIIVSSVGFVILFILLIWFIVRKVRQY